uniref:Midkine n=1 Tax=Neogobius melanostomus TaxID=47308 RepID=A0A8C6SUZ8_9GOBI
MRGLVSLTLLLLLALTLSVDAGRGGKSNKHKGKQTKAASECTTAETEYGKCVPEQGDCGEGQREVTCKGQTNKIHCKVPCNWKKDINDCKYKFGLWGPCDATSHTKSRSGSLKRALFNADCQKDVTVSKPCSPKVKKTRGDKKSA